MTACGICGRPRCCIRAAWWAAQNEIAEEVEQRIAQEFIDRAVDSLLLRQGVPSQHIGRVLVSGAVELLGVEETIKIAAAANRNEGMG